MRNLGFFLFSIVVFATRAGAQDLNFDEPAVNEKKDSPLPTSMGPVSNIQIGGAVDWRTTYQSGAKRPFSFIHVNEFVISASVGPHVAVSAEQLLLTSELGSVVAQDHGFVVVNLIQLPFLPDGLSAKVGRFRGKFGADAQTDSPANIFPSQEVRSNGIVTDIGLGLDYTISDNLEAYVEVFNGVDFKVEGGQKSSYVTKALPVQTRVVFQPTSAMKFGLSGFVGETWDNQISPETLDQGSLGSSYNQSRTIDRQRLALDASLKTSKADFLVEGIVGRDKGRLSQPVGKSYTKADGLLLRTDIPLFRISDETRTKVAVQYDSWKDASYAGRVAFLSSAFSMMSDDGWTVRLGGTTSDIVFKKKPAYIERTPWSVTTQLLVSF